MTPVGYGHGHYFAGLIRLLARLAPEWESGSQLGIETSEGVKAPDVTLASPAYHAKYRNHQGYVSEAPEICIEVMSPSNSWPEMLGKMPLYFEVGAREVWIVDTDGTVSFFGPGNEALDKSGIIPGMPGDI